MRKIILSLIFTIFLISLISSLPVPPPHAFYGTVNYSNGNPLLTGIIRAELNGIINTAEIINGEYGYDGSLKIESDLGGMIYFYLEETGELLGEYEFEELGVTKLDFILEESEEPEPPAENQTKSHSTLIYCGDGKWDEYCSDYLDYQEGLYEFNDTQYSVISNKIDISTAPEENNYPFYLMLILLILNAFLVIIIFIKIVR